MNLYLLLLGLFSLLNLSLFLSFLSSLFSHVSFSACFSTALENEVLRNPKPPSVDCSVLDLNPTSAVPTEVYVEGYHDNLCDPGIFTRGRRRSLTGGEEMVAAALNRIQELEKEAETLEEAYRSYKRKGVMPHVPFKGTSPPPPCASATFVRPIGAVKNRGVTEDAYTVTIPDQCPAGHMTPPALGSPPIRRLSSTPVSASKTKPRAHTKQGKRSVQHTHCTRISQTLNVTINE